MAYLNVVVIGILNRADPALKYAQQKIFQNGPILGSALVDKCVKLFKSKNKLYALRSQKYIMVLNFIAAIT